MKALLCLAFLCVASVAYACPAQVQQVQQVQAYYAAPVVQQVGGVTLTNNVTAGGTTNQLDDFTSLTVYATDAAAIRNNIYQLGRKVKLLTDALRTIGGLQNADA